MLGHPGREVGATAQNESAGEPYIRNPQQWAGRAVWRRRCIGIEWSAFSRLVEDSIDEALPQREIITPHSLELLLCSQFVSPRAIEVYTTDLGGCAELNIEMHMNSFRSLFIIEISDMEFHQYLRLSSKIGGISGKMRIGVPVYLVPPRPGIMAIPAAPLLLRIIPVNPFKYLRLRDLEVFLHVVGCISHDMPPSTPLPT